jgi:hypothetical protein
MIRPDKIEELRRRRRAVLRALPTGSALSQAQYQIAIQAGLADAFRTYEMVPLGPRDLIFSSELKRWVDRRTTDGEILAVDRRNAK